MATMASGGVNSFLLVAHNDDGTLKDGLVTNATVANAANIAKSKLASLNIADSDVDAISQSKITNLSADFSAKASASTTITTATQWTISEVNGAEAGMEVV